MLLRTYEVKPAKKRQLPCSRVRFDTSGKTSKASQVINTILLGCLSTMHGICAFEMNSIGYAQRKFSVMLTSS